MSWPEANANANAKARAQALRQPRAGGAEPGRALSRHCRRAGPRAAFPRSRPGPFGRAPPLPRGRFRRARFLFRPQAAMASRKEGSGAAGGGFGSAKGKGKAAAAGDSAVKQVQIDGLVVLKIIKHYQEEGQGNEVVQGVLLGLVVDDRLEITNCFPFPQHTEDDADFDEVQYQMEMMRSLRHVNIDHLHVGWYQSTYYGSFVTRALLDSQFSYQHAIEESVVLIYDPIKTAQGSLSLKAYRLTPKLMEVCKEKDFSPEALKKANIAYENMFEEVPIVIKNSYLINVMLWELEKKSAVADRHELLSLASSISRDVSKKIYSVKAEESPLFLRRTSISFLNHHNRLQEWSHSLLQVKLIPIARILRSSMHRIWASFSWLKLSKITITEETLLKPSTKSCKTESAWFM
uniref:Eukaryotic translation initiation factor 3 subunit H n=1 Tax=Taeniopygia guttata TaxID=59729 RepID=H0ZPZ4_TAEGU